jgi:Asp-tRNA(Asn)/Glu-tRNA(Gln) amidotransferase A subunit family amidase
MSDTDNRLSDVAVKGFAEQIGLSPDEDLFEAYTELLHTYADQCESLYLPLLDNGDVPALSFQITPPTNDAPVTFEFVSEPDLDLPTEQDDLAFLSIGELSALLKARSISPVELTQLYLDRLDATGRALNSVVTLTSEHALAQARIAEEEIGRGEWRGPLHGVPWGAKDLLATRGIPTTWGSSAHKQQVFDYDSAVVERLNGAGAVLCAKLSMGSLAYGPNWFGGMTRNPWNTETGASGSSAGPGAATAAGLVGFSIGTETHGSITSPSHTNGVVGLRPTYGRVSRFGAMALGYSLDKIGPMCRRVEDCAAVFSAIAGRDRRDEVTRDAGFAWPDDRDIRSMRIGYVGKEFGDVEGAAGEVDREALDVFRALGATVEPIELPEFSKGMMIILWVEAAAAFDELVRSKDLDLLKNDNSQWPKIFRAAQSVPATAYLRAQRLRKKLIAAFDVTMRDWDAIACPAQGGASLTLGNLTGNPSLTLPVGFADDMPRGMTLIGRLWDEASLLSLGHAFESETEWHTRRPPAHA